MCGPLALAGASMALGIGQSAMQFMGQNAAYAANERAANEQYAATSNAVSQQAEQVNAKQSEDTLTNAVAAAQGYGRIAASATTMGAGPSSAGNAMNAEGVTAGRRQGITDLNANNARMQLGQELKGADLRRVSTINSVQPGNIASLALGIAGSAMGGGRTYYASGGKNLGQDISSFNFGV